MGNSASATNSIGDKQETNSPVENRNGDQLQPPNSCFMKYITAIARLYGVVLFIGKLLHCINFTELYGHARFI